MDVNMVNNALLTNLAVLLVVIGVCDAGLFCSVCNDSVPVCDRKTMSCHSNCKQTVECEEGFLCVATWWVDDIKESEIYPWLGCFPAISPYGEKCKATKSQGALTCLCNADNCNEEIIVPKELFPEYKDEEEASSHNNSNSAPPLVTVTIIGVSSSGESILEPAVTSPLPPTNRLTNNYIIAITFSIAVPIIIFSVLATIVCCTHKRKQRKEKEKYEEAKQAFRKGSASADMRSVVNFVNSGSKSAIYESVLMSDLLPHESEKDSNDNLSVQLDGLLARGQFAQIWKGSMVKDGIQRPVAVKIFSPDQYKSWAQETEFYTDLRVSLRHSHILEYITSRENINGTPQQHWIITAYHEHGSLRDYLTKYVISWNELCTMGKTLMSGLAQLHSYSTGQDYIPKIPVAHRDMKSSNVLVKCDGTCAIADFGLAMKLDPLTSIDELANMGQVGTPRYMSPEALDCKINLADIESFKHCDMYSVALIIWEMMSRCSISSTMGDYKLPYSDHVPSNPSIEMMKGVLIRDKRRPDVPASWNEHKGMRSLVDTMVDCWDDDPDARLTASCVEFRLGNLSRLDDADFDIFGETRLLDEIDSGMASSTSQVTSSRESTVSSPLHKPRKGPRSTATTRPSVTSEFSDESGMSEVVSPSHRSQRCYKKSFNSDISEENEIIELVNDDDLPMFRQSILISIE